MTSLRMRVWTLCLLLTGVAPAMGHAQAIGWPEAVGRLAGERSKAETCRDALKGHGNPDQIARGRVMYGTAKAEFDAVIAGLTVVLGEGDKPESLSAINARLEQGASGLKQFCDWVAPLVPPDEGRRGVVTDIAKGAIEPVVKALSEGVAALYNNHRKDKALTRQTIQTQLEAAKWPDFGEVKEAR
jgi:hypothetical protein